MKKVKNLKNKINRIKYSKKFKILIFYLYELNFFQAIVFQLLKFKNYHLLKFVRIKKH